MTDNSDMMDKKYECSSKSCHANGSQYVKMVIWKVRHTSAIDITLLRKLPIPAFRMLLALSQRTAISVQIPRSSYWANARRTRQKEAGSRN